MGMKPFRHIEIQLVKDSPADVLIMQEAYDEAKLLNTIRVMEGQWGIGDGIHTPIGILRIRLPQI